MQDRVLIKDLAAREDGPVRVAGWVEKVRDQRYVQFVVLRDESGAVQLVNGGVLREPDPENPRSDILVPRTRTISELTHGTFVTVTGELQHNERVKLGGVEIQIDEIEVVTQALPDNPVADDSGIDVRLDWRFLDLRRPEQNLVFRVQTTFLHALRQVWVERGFIEIQTPKLMASASESRAELFEVEYFEGKAFLAQSPQFFKQMAQAAGFGGIVCNRPDGEEPGQPAEGGIAAAAREAGLEFRSIPVSGGLVRPGDLDRFRAALDEMPGPVLAYCRSGTRCTMLWSMAQFGRMRADDIVGAAARAGYDMAPLVAQMTRVSD